METEDIEQMKEYFNVKDESGRTLPNPKSVSDSTTFYLLEPDGVYVEHKMFNGKWHRKIIDGNDQVTLEEV